MEEVKKTLVLQQFGGVKKQLKDGKFTRDRIHVLIIGDAGCVSGDSYITLADGTFKKIGGLGNSDREKINLDVLTKDGNKIANEFWKFKDNEVKEIILEDGRSLICNYRHPLLVNDKWVRMEDLKVGDEVKVINKINCTKKDLVSFKNIEKFKKNSKDIKIPKINERVGFLMGMFDGDGGRNKYKVGLYVGEQKKSILGKAHKIILEEFGINPRFSVRKPKNSKIGDRIIYRKENTYILEVDSIKFSSLMNFNKSTLKRVPEYIMQSKDSVVASYLDGLFSTDGSCFIDKRIDRKDKICISIKSMSDKLLKDVQLLLLRFGINGRISGNELNIKKQEEVILFKEYIGFSNEHKQKILNKVKRLKVSQKSKEYQKIKSIEIIENRDVYDLTVPDGHNYISNGIVSHNTSKTQLGKNVAIRTPRSFYTSGEQTTAVGLTASVEKDELTGNWGLKAGAMCKANNSILIVDEVDKAGEQALRALHTPLESGIIPVSKAGINTHLKAECSLLALANPKGGRFNLNSKHTIVEQINMPSTLLSRFDIIHIVKDEINEEKDNNIIDSIFNGGELLEEINVELYRKYLIYAKKLKPKFTKEIIEELKKFYNKIKKMSLGPDSKLTGMPITPRNIQGIIRMAEASAKIRLSEEVELKDLKIAQNLYYESLIKIGLDEDGTIDMARIGFGKTLSKKKKSTMILEHLTEIYLGTGKPVEDYSFKQLMMEKGILENEYHETIFDLNREGYIIRKEKGWVVI